MTSIREKHRDHAAQVAAEGVIAYLEGTPTSVAMDEESAGGGLVNHALGRSYSISPAANGSYPDAATGQYYNGTDWSGSKLTDGAWGGVYNSGQSVGWDSGTAAVITFNLGSAKDVAKVIARGRYGAAGVYRPTSFKVEYSDNGSAWTTAHEATGLSNGAQPGDRDWSALCPTNDVGEHQHWRLTLGRSQTAGHFVFVNEVELWGAE